MRVNWTITAQEHLQDIYNYIARNSSDYALRMVDRLTRRTQQIADVPFSGRRVPEYDIEQIREVIEHPYRIIYYIKPAQIDIIAGLHGARNLLSDEEPKG